MTTMNCIWDRLWKPWIQWILIGAGLALLTGVLGCTPAPKMNAISLTPDARGFVDAVSGQAFVPFGTNYYDPNTGWPPHVWSQFNPDRVKAHFKLMQKLGVNCARVFLTAAAFQPDTNSVNDQALKKLDKLISIARSCGIRLIVTAPTDWEGEPAYWKPDQFTSEAALRASQNLWTALGRRYQGEPVIFAWDIAGEPQMPWHVDSWDPSWNAWLRAKYVNHDGLKTAWGKELSDTEQLGTVAPAKDVAAAGNPRLYDWQLFREQLADDWVKKQVQTLRGADPTHLITIGYVQWSYPILRPGEPHLYPAFNPRRQAQWLDFVSVHYYPIMSPFSSPANWTQYTVYLQTVLAYCHAGKPVVLEEYGWYGGGVPPEHPSLSEKQQVQWITQEIEASRRLAQGWLSWPFADTPEATDMAVFGGLVDNKMNAKEWALQFNRYVAGVSTLPQPTPDLPSFDFGQSLTAPSEGSLERQEEYGRLVQAALEKANSTPQAASPSTR
jgi:hypothetical protein